MSNYCSFFLPIKLNKFSCIKILNKFNFDFPLNINANGPFFCIENENCTIDFFLRALFNSSFEEAKKFVSSDLNNLLDLDAFKECFDPEVSYKYLSSGSFDLKSKSCFVNSVLFIDKKRGEESIINFYLVNQPDSFSRFKIYAIT